MAAAYSGNFRVGRLVMPSVNQEIGNGTLLFVETNGQRLLAEFILKSFHALSFESSSCSAANKGGLHEAHKTSMFEQNRIRNE